MGVCGVGKTTVAKACGEQFCSGFVEADDYHPPENIKAMRKGIPLTDEMRWGWLDRVATAVLAEQKTKPKPIFLACSGLKKSYRDWLRRALGQMPVILLTAERGLLEGRMTERDDHFMPPELLGSQLEALEIPEERLEGALHIDAGLPLRSIVSIISNHLRQKETAAEN